jgi:hypothetical protein
MSGHSINPLLFTMGNRSEASAALLEVVLCFWEVCSARTYKLAIGRPNNFADTCWLRFRLTSL